MLEIRPLHPDDYPALTNLWVESWQQALPQIDFEQRRAWFEAYLPELKAQGFELIGAFNNQQILGFIAINSKTSILDQITVSVATKGQNIGAQLIDAAKRVSPTKIILNVNIDNPRAIHFYKKNEFIKTGVTGKNTLSGLEFIEMQWQLNS
jgi:putative acetyltransferase